MNYGFIRKECENNEEYVFGSNDVPRLVLRQDGNWIPFLPEYEPQFNSNFDTSACTIFGTINAVEILMARLFMNEIKSPNYSERFHYNLIPIRPPGGDPHAAAESIRRYGMVDQDVLPMTETFDEYVTPEPVPLSVLEEGEAWLDKYDFKHEYLWKRDLSLNKRNAILKEALQYSPIGVSVTAWHQSVDGQYDDLGRPNNHWCVVVSYIEIEGVIYFNVFDSYDHKIKTLSHDHHIEVAKRYYIEIRKEARVKKKGIIKCLIRKLGIWYNDLRNESTSSQPQIV